MFIRKGLYLSPDTGGADASGMATPEPTDTGTDTGTGPEPIRIGDQQYTAEELQAAIASHRNEQNWRSELSNRANEINTLAKALESRGGNVPVNAQPMEAADLRDLLLENPAEFQRLMGEQVTQMVRDQMTQITEQQALENSFLGRHNDFNTAVSSPEFQAFRATLPAGYNDVAAFYEYKLQNMSKSMDSEKARIRKEVEQEVLKNQQAKSNLGTVLNSGGTTPPQTPPAQQGLSRAENITRVAAMLEANRQARGE